MGTDRLILLGFLAFCALGSTSRRPRGQRPGGRAAMLRLGRIRDILELRGGWNSNFGGSSWGGGQQQQSSGSMFGMTSPESNKKVNPENDPECPNPPADGISDLKFSPNAPALAGKHYLAATSWDKSIRCWQVGAVPAEAGATTSPSGPKSVQIQQVGSQQSQAPILSCAWKDDGSGIVFGSADNTVKLWTLGTNQVRDIGRHNAPVCAVVWATVPQPCVITGSYDGTVKFWNPDAMGGQPIFNINIPGKVHALDAKGSMLVVVTSERKYLVYNLQNPSAPFKQIKSTLKSQLRTVGVSHDQMFYCLGAVEGRVGVEHVQDKDVSKNFAFKCHRKYPNGAAHPNNCEVYPVNHLSFHPLGTFGTVGADGTFSYWDKFAKSRLKRSQESSLPFTACGFSHDGRLFAYAASYDWHQGRAGVAKYPDKPAIMVRQTGNDARPKGAPTPAPTSPYRW